MCVIFFVALSALKAAAFHMINIPFIHLCMNLDSMRCGLKDFIV